MVSSLETGCTNMIRSEYIMGKIKIKFESIEDVNRFVQILSKYDSDFDLYCGSYCVDAKSLLGIMTMDLRNSMWMTGNCDNNIADKVIRELEDVVSIAA